MRACPLLSAATGPARAPAGEQRATATLGKGGDHRHPKWGQPRDRWMNFPYETSNPPVAAFRTERPWHPARRGGSGVRRSPAALATTSTAVARDRPAIPNTRPAGGPGTRPHPAAAAPQLTASRPSPLRRNPPAPAGRRSAIRRRSTTQHHPPAADECHDGNRGRAVPDR
jgi:hypothetical protein